MISNWSWVERFRTSPSRRPDPKTRGISGTASPSSGRPLSCGAALVLCSQQVIRALNAKRLLISPSRKRVARPCDWRHGDAIICVHQVIQNKRARESRGPETFADFWALLGGPAQCHFRRARFDEGGCPGHRDLRFIEIAQALEEMRHPLIDFDVDIDVGGRRAFAQAACVVL